MKKLLSYVFVLVFNLLVMVGCDGCEDDFYVLTKSECLAANDNNVEKAKYSCPQFFNESKADCDKYFGSSRHDQLVYCSEFYKVASKEDCITKYGNENPQGRYECIPFFTQTKEDCLNYYSNSGKPVCSFCPAFLVNSIQDCKECYADYPNAKDTCAKQFFNSKEDCEAYYGNIDVAMLFCPQYYRALPVYKSLFDTEYNLFFGRGVVPIPRYVNARKCDGLLPDVGCDTYTYSSSSSSSQNTQISSQSSSSSVLQIAYQSVEIALKSKKYHVSGLFYQTGYGDWDWTYCDAATGGCYALIGFDGATFMYRDGLVPRPSKNYDGYFIQFGSGAFDWVYLPASDSSMVLRLGAKNNKIDWTLLNTLKAVDTSVPGDSGFSFYDSGSLVSSYGSSVSSISSVSSSSKPSSSISSVNGDITGEWSVSEALIYSCDSASGIQKSERNDNQNVYIIGTNSAFGFQMNYDDGSGGIYKVTRSGYVDGNKIYMSGKIGDEILSNYKQYGYVEANTLSCSGNMSSNNNYGYFCFAQFSMKGVSKKTGSMETIASCNISVIGTMSR